MNIPPMEWMNATAREPYELESAPKECPHCKMKGRNYGGGMARHYECKSVWVEGTFTQTDACARNEALGVELAATRKLYQAAKAKDANSL